MSGVRNMLTVAAISSATSILAVLTALPMATADPGTCDPVPSAENSCAGLPPQTWPIAQGNFTTAGDPGWIFFKPFGQYGCGIGPDGTIGCDHVPSDPWAGASPGCGDKNCPPPPPGANQTVASPGSPARYVDSDVPTFTRDVGDLPEGHRLVNGDAWCAAGYQGSLSCVSGSNGFTLAWWGGVLEKP